jgi:hypothetical protein
LIARKISSCFRGVHINDLLQGSDQPRQVIDQRAGIWAYRYPIARPILEAVTYYLDARRGSQHRDPITLK